MSPSFHDGLTTIKHHLKMADAFLNNDLNFDKAILKLNTYLHGKTQAHMHIYQITNTQTSDVKKWLFPVMLTLSSLVSKAVADPVKTQSEKPRTYTPRYLKK